MPCERGRGIPLALGKGENCLSLFIVGGRKTGCHIILFKGRKGREMNSFSPLRREKRKRGILSSGGLHPVTTTIEEGLTFLCLIQ